MGFLFGFHGALAVVLLCSLLFVEEAGVPLPFAPGELTLVVAGLLVAAGGLDPFVFIPCAFAACVLGATVGFSWARLVGEKGLEALAQRLHRAGSVERITRRIQAAGPARIGITRLIPGLRIYTTLVAGAAGVAWRSFYLGMVPATAIWVTAFVLLGALVGVPIEHLLGQVERLALQGAILIVIGVGGYLALRRSPSVTANPLVRLPGELRTGLAVVVDAAVVASTVAGLASLVRRFSGAGVRASWADGVVVVAAIAVIYLFLARRSAGATVGEALLRTTYLRRRWRLRRRSGATAGPGSDQLAAAAESLRLLASPARLRVVEVLLQGWASPEELGRATGLGADELEFHLAVLERSDLLEHRGSGERAQYRVAEPSAAWLETVISGAAELGASAPAPSEP